MMRILILGTGTSVGKTYVTCALSRALHVASPSTPILAMKPVETGVLPGSPSSDHVALAALCQHVDPIPPICTFPEPLSPHLAARRSGLHVTPELLVPPLRQASDTGPGLCLIETAGGAFTPLAPGFTNAHLALALEPSVWILVAPDALGVLHDVHSTLTTLRLVARAPDALVLSQSRPPDLSTGTNAAELAALGLWPDASVVPRDARDPLADLAAALHRALAASQSTPRREGR